MGPLKRFWNHKHTPNQKIKISCKIWYIVILYFCTFLKSAHNVSWVISRALLDGCWNQPKLMVAQIKSPPSHYDILVYSYCMFWVHPWCTSKVAVSFTVAQHTFAKSSHSNRILRNFVHFPVGHVNSPRWPTESSLVRKGLLCEHYTSLHYWPSFDRKITLQFH